MAVLLLDHANVAPAGVLAKVVLGIVVPAHCTMGVIALTVGLGLTVIVNVVGAPVQPANVGVTEIVLVMAELVAFVAVNAGKFPVPLAPNPIAVLLFVQANVAPAGVLLNAVDGTATPGQ